MLNITLTSINCEVKSMAIYIALLAMVKSMAANIFPSVSSTFSWEFEYQLNAAHIGSLDIWTIIYTTCMTHGDKKLDLEYGDGDIHGAQNESSSECVEEYAFPSFFSLELDSPLAV